MDSDKLLPPEVEKSVEMAADCAGTALVEKTFTPTKEKMKQFIKSKLSSNEKWAYKALLTIYDLQTLDEKTAKATVYDNKVGFSGVDAEILSSFASQLKKRGFLTAKQMVILYKKMPKYWEQIFNASDKAKLVLSMGGKI